MPVVPGGMGAGFGEGFDTEEVTLTSSILAYLQSAWGTVVAGGTASIVWGSDWFNPRFPDMPQVSVTDLTFNKHEAYSTDGSLTFKYAPKYLVNVWQKIPTGSDGTAETATVEGMRLHVAKLMREGIINAYGGSLTFNVVLPDNAGMRLHELNATPRMLRYEITLTATVQNEP